MSYIVYYLPNWCWVLCTVFATCSFGYQILFIFSSRDCSWFSTSCSPVNTLHTMFVWCIPTSCTVRSVVSRNLWCVPKIYIWTLTTSYGLLACRSTFKLIDQTCLSFEWSLRQCSQLGVLCRRLQWCRKTGEVLQGRTIWSWSGIEDGKSSSWWFPHAQGVHVASTGRSFLVGDWERQPRCCGWSLLCNCGYPWDMPPWL